MSLNFKFYKYPILILSMDFSCTEFYVNPCIKEECQKGWIIISSHGLLFTLFQHIDILYKSIVVIGHEENTRRLQTSSDGWFWNKLFSSTTQCRKHLWVGHLVPLLTPRLGCIAYKIHHFHSAKNLRIYGYGLPALYEKRENINKTEKCKETKPQTIVISYCHLRRFR